METTAYRQSRESRAFDFDHAADDPQVAPYSFGRAEMAHHSHHDPMPLFLSDPEGEPDPQEFVAMRTRSRIVPRVLGGVLAAATIAFMITLFQSDIARLLVVTASASMGGAATEQAAAAPASSAPAVRQIPLKDPARVSNPMLASVEAREIAPPAMPSREAIATAYQTALQSQTPVQAPVQAPVLAPAAPPPPPVAAAPARTIDADTLAGLMTRANSLMAVGDIAAARLLLERAANAQDASAAFMLAQTYDPAVLGTKDTRSITADPAAARDWYRKAAQLGSPEARQRLTQLQN
jgi:hypothetical protein